MWNYRSVFGSVVFGMGILIAIGCQTVVVNDGADSSVDLKHEFTEFPLSVTNSDGTQTIFDRSPKRMVIFDAAAVEILFQIGEAERIVGTHEFVVYPD